MQLPVVQRPLIQPALGLQPSYQYAPPAQPTQVFDLDTPLVFDYTLTPGETEIGLQCPVAVDADFFCCGLQASSAIAYNPSNAFQAGLFNLRISDSTGYKLMSGFMPLQLFTQAYGNPYPYVVRPKHRFVAGTYIGIDLQEVSNIANTVNVIQIMFRGWYRYRLSDVQAQEKLDSKARY